MHRAVLQQRAGRPQQPNVAAAAHQRPPQNIRELLHNPLLPCLRRLTHGLLFAYISSLFLLPPAARDRD